VKEPQLDLAAFRPKEFRVQPIVVILVGLVVVVDVRQLGLVQSPKST
jgi:hypothetical protein